ncbi:Crp/Fnr family transcriptional regulator [Dehalobacter sp. TBBPA1]|uniref:Crp/Fnr family transcriptional regulator n=1 Tax=Dehalobacter sp. TBBPA1 TaxID=3235037 RepID=UPI0034A392CE
MEEELNKNLVPIPDTFFPVERFQQHVDLGTTKYFAKGSVVVMPGEATSVIIYVVSGKLRVDKIIDDGRERLLYYAGQYGLIGRLYETCNDIYVMAIEDSRICFFSKQQLREVFRRDEELVFDLLKNYVTKMSYYIKQFAEIDCFSPAVRIVRLLYELYLTQSIPLEDSYEINIDLSLKNISEITGAHYVTVSKVLNCLKSENILEKKKNKIIIYDSEKLKTLTQGTHIFIQNNYISLSYDMQIFGV